MSHFQHFSNCEISDWVDATGFTGHREVEIFSKKGWATDQNLFLDQIASSYAKLYAQSPAL